MSRAADSVDAGPEDDVTRIEREIDDDPVVVTIVENKRESRIVVDGECRWEFIIDEDEWAYPRWEDRSHPQWMEPLLIDLGVRGIRGGR